MPSRSLSELRAIASDLELRKIDELGKSQLKNIINNELTKCGVESPYRTAKKECKNLKQIWDRDLFCRQDKRRRHHRNVTRVDDINQRLDKQISEIVYKRKGRRDCIEKRKTMAEREREEMDKLLMKKWAQKKEEPTKITQYEPEEESVSGDEFEMAGRVDDESVVSGESESEMAGRVDDESVVSGESESEMAGRVVDESVVSGEFEMAGQMEEESVSNKVDVETSTDAFDEDDKEWGGLPLPASSLGGGAASTKPLLSEPEEMMPTSSLQEEDTIYKQFIQARKDRDVQQFIGMLVAADVLKSRRKKRRGGGKRPEKPKRKYQISGNGNVIQNINIFGTRVDQELKRIKEGNQGIQIIGIQNNYNSSGEQKDASELNKACKKLYGDIRTFDKLSWRSYRDLITGLINLYFRIILKILGFVYQYKEITIPAITILVVMYNGGITFFNPITLTILRALVPGFSLAENVLNKLGSTYGRIQVGTEDLWGKGVNASQDMWGKGVNASQDMWGKGMNASQDMWGKGVNASQDMWGKGMNASQDMWGKGVNASQDMWGRGMNASQDMWGKGMNASQDMWGKGINTTGDLVGNFDGTILGNTTGNTTTAFTFPPDDGSSAYTFVPGTVYEGDLGSNYVDIGNTTNITDTNSFGFGNFSYDYTTGGYTYSNTTSVAEVNATSVDVDANGDIQLIDLSVNNPVFISRENYNEVVNSTIKNTTDAIAQNIRDIVAENVNATFTEAIKANLTEIENIFVGQNEVSEEVKILVRNVSEGVEVFKNEVTFTLDLEGVVSVDVIVKNETKKINSQRDDFLRKIKSKIPGVKFVEKAIRDQFNKIERNLGRYGEKIKSIHDDIPPFPPKLVETIKTKVQDVVKFDLRDLIKYLGHYELNEPKAIKLLEQRSESRLERMLERAASEDTTDLSQSLTQQVDDNTDTIGQAYKDIVDSLSAPSPTEISEIELEGLEEITQSYIDNGGLTPMETPIEARDSEGDKWEAEPSLSVEETKYYMKLYRKIKALGKQPAAVGLTGVILWGTAVNRYRVKPEVEEIIRTYLRDERGRFRRRTPDEERR